MEIIIYYEKAQIALIVMFSIATLLTFSTESCKKDIIPNQDSNQIDRYESYLKGKVPMRTVRNVAISYRASLYSDFKNKAYNNYTICRVDSATDTADLATMYLVEFCNDSGWVIISADYRMEPILGHLDSGSYDAVDVNNGLALWAITTNSAIAYLRDNDSTVPGARLGWVSLMSSWTDWEIDLPPITIPEQWEYDYGDPNDPNYDPCDVAPWVDFTKGPLMNSEWGQDRSFNEDCPVCLTNPNGFMPTGCVPTAAGQIMKYWSEPSSIFDFSLMPLGEGTSSTQHLLESFGDEAGTVYTCDISTTFSTDARYVLDKAYGYSDAKYVDFNLSTVANEIIANKPVYLRGCGADTRWSITVGRFFGINLLTLNFGSRSNCHAWVCEGLKYKKKFCDQNKQRNVEYYMNWGWTQYSAAGVRTSNGGNGWYHYNEWFRNRLNGTEYIYANKMIYDIEF